ncbi:hypothetical protein FS837_005543 [Tulasnella sp. UAMH 9824]|nr:hypothetical protein FS837_005543 [Tulasnella sp. UAMH 9824]
MEETPRQDDLEDASDDPTDSTYQEVRTPTSLYQWAYLYLKFVPVKYNLANDEQLHELVVRMFRAQQYDAELFGMASQNAYPPAEDLEHNERQSSFNPPIASRNTLRDIPSSTRWVAVFAPVVSHVDSRFRAIAESTASLWTTIDVYLPLPIVSLYLERSNPALLDVQIDFWYGGPGRAESQLRALSTVLADHRERIASLSMSSPWEEVADMVVKAMMIGPGLMYPQLRKLDAGCRMWNHARQTRTGSAVLICPLVVPPQLQELSLRGSRLRNWVTAFSEPLAELKSLSLVNHTTLSLSDVLIVLANLSSLETLVFQDCVIERDPHTAPPAVTLPNLTTLQYVTLPNKSITFMPEAILSPKLTCLKLWWDHCNKNQWEQAHTWLEQAHALTLILSANPQLESLDLCNCTIEQQGWKEPLSKVRYLKSLRLLWCESESNNLGALLELGLEEDVEQDLLPYLEHLVLDNVFHLTTKDIRRVITRRPGLRFLELRGWDGSNVAEEDVKFIRESVKYFILETFCNDSGALEDEDEESEGCSSSGTPSEGSWLSGDDAVSPR